MKKAVACVLISGLLMVACTGSFNATRQVHDIHRSEQEKWLDEAIFLASVIVQVYTVSVLADAIVFNTIEFWSGKNPIQKPDPAEDRAGAREGRRLGFRYHARNDAIQIDGDADGFPEMVLLRTPGGIVVTDLNGERLLQSTRQADGSVTVVDRQHQVLLAVGPETVRRARQRYGY